MRSKNKVLSRKLLRIF